MRCDSPVGGLASCEPFRIALAEDVRIYLMEHQMYIL